MEINLSPLISSLAIAIIIFPLSAISVKGNTFRDCSECPVMVEIGKGSFLMGSDIGRDDETPMHRVTINYHFAVGKFEITRAQYAAFIKDTNTSPDLGCEVYDLPSFNMDLEKSWLQRLDPGVAAPGERCRRKRLQGRLRRPALQETDQR